jgi:hypothetical protein
MRGRMGFILRCLRGWLLFKAFDRGEFPPWDEGVLMMFPVVVEVIAGEK